MAYFSRQLHGAEVNYSSTELECLGVVAAIKPIEVYLAGRKFLLMTDHQALTGMSTSTNHNRRLTRWALYLQDSISPCSTGQDPRMAMLIGYHDRVGEKRCRPKTEESVPVQAKQQTDKKLHRIYRIHQHLEGQQEP